MDRLIKPIGLIISFLLIVWLGSAIAAETEPPESFGGVGIQVVPTITGQLVVLNVLPDSPAAAKHILPGDLIVQVDTVPLQGSEFADVVANHLWGPIGSEVTLHYLRPGVAGPRSVVLKRAAMEPRLTVSPTTREHVKE